MYHVRISCGKQATTRPRLELSTWPVVEATKMTACSCGNCLMSYAFMATACAA